MLTKLTKPDLVLRVGFAGNRNLPPDRLGELETALAAVYATIGTWLKEIAPGVPLEGPAARITQFYPARPPLLRLVTGLAEGADALAAQVLLHQPEDAHLRRETAAVLPFDRDAYRFSSQGSIRTGLF